jgi:hypothetical protein
LELLQLLKIEGESRDDDWESEFLAKIPEAVVRVDDPSPQREFDGWPYLHVSTVEGAGEPVAKIIPWLSERGIGLIVNSQKSSPDYVFSYGMLWGYRARGRFLGDLAAKNSGSEVFDEGKYKIFGPPAEAVLPPYARTILRQFLHDQGILAPKILVASEDGREFDFCFSVESLGHPPTKEHEGILEALSWFFPPDYSLMLTKEENLPPFTLL